ncbi:septal ring lytic transglycosylase RlpA family protein [Micromonospora sp. NPDC049559]|uniref:septal ring lytic transglycosylase RlpA family protein n=1 Tax=Micromonospora sp. NPDC049559 TaxID=3155923 RepID=UPI00342D6F37
MGKHSRSRIFRSPAGLAATAAVGAALAVGGTVGGIHLAAGGTDSASPTVATAVATVEPAGATPTATATATATPSATAAPTSPAATRSPQHASRGIARKPSPTPTVKKTVKPSPKVVSSGSCGASFYDEGQMTANGETFDPDALTAAHKTLPFNTRVRVTNPANGKSVVVRINDRGPYVDGRCLDLSRAAFQAIAPLSQGEATVRYEVLG